MHLVESLVLRVLQHFDARAPRVEHEPVQEHARKLAQRRPVVEALQSHARTPHSHRLQLGHLGYDVGEGKPNVIDARPLRAAHRGLDGEDQLHAVAVGGVWLAGHSRAVEVPAIPAHGFRRAGGGDLDVMQFRGERRRCRDGPGQGGESDCAQAGHGERTSSVVNGWAPCGGGRTSDPRHTRRT